MANDMDSTVDALKELLNSPGASEKIESMLGAVLGGEKGGVNPCLLYTSSPAARMTNDAPQRSITSGNIVAYAPPQTTGTQDSFKIAAITSSTVSRYMELMTDSPIKTGFSFFIWPHRSASSVSVVWRG